MKSNTAEKQSETQADREPIKVGSELHLHSTKTDNRRDKRYHRTVTATVSVLLANWGTSDVLTRNVDYNSTTGTGAPSPARLIHVQLKNLADGFTKQTPAKVQVVSDSHCSHAGVKASADGYEYEVTYGLRARFDADKPSEISSEKECIELLGGNDELRDRIRKAIQGGLDEAEVERERYVRVANADHLLDSFLKVCRERAQQAVRYEQRQAALDAEYLAEVKVQTERFVAEDGTELSFAENFNPDERAIKAALGKLVDKAADEVAPHVRFGRLPTSAARSDFNVEDVD